MTEVILYAEDEGIAIQASVIRNKVKLHVDDVTNDRIALSINTTDYVPYEPSKIIELLESQKVKHFRSLLNIDDEISLFESDNNLSDEELVYVFFNGHGVISIHGTESIGIKKDKSNNHETVKSFLPSHIVAALDYLREAEPDEPEEINHILHDAINTKEKLHGLLHSRTSPSLKETINFEILFLESHITSLKVKKRKLIKRPSFEATRRKLLIADLESFMKKNGFENELNQIKSDVLRKATESIGTTESDAHKQLKEQLSAHPLNERFIEYFKVGRPSPLPLFKCKQCGSNPSLKNVKHPKTGKKRFIVTCSHCDNKPKEHIHGNSSNAIYHWTKDCAKSEGSPSTVKPLMYSESADGNFSEYVKLLNGYIDTYKAFLKSYQDVNDDDSANFVSATMGKLRHLSDGVLIGKLLQKRLMQNK